VILIDARKGVLTQTRRHTRIVQMLGIREIIVAVNKMDLVGWDLDTYLNIEREYLAFAKDLGFKRIHCIPLSALNGDNVLQLGENSPWYGGPSFIQLLEDIEVAEDPGSALRMPVQWVNRPHSDFRGFCGRIAGGSVRPGDRVCIIPSGVRTEVKSVMIGDAEVPEARKGQSVTLTLAGEVDVSRGDVIAAASSPVEAADQFEARLLWMHPNPLMAGRQYLVKLHTRQAGASVTEIKYRLDVNTGAHLAAKSVGMNEIAVVNLGFDCEVAFEPYSVNRTLGGFVLIDRLTKETVGAGMIDFALRRASNVHWQAVDVNRHAREKQKGQRARCFWFTGLSASGKSTIANLLDKRLHSAGLHAYLLDGDNVRHGLNRDLGFTEADRVENIRRVAEVAKLMVDAGLIVLVSFISPFKSDRAFARSLFKAGDFVEVFVDASLEVCEQRDPKGLYAKARAGNLKNFTGIDSPYEPPESPEIWVKTDRTPAADAAEMLARQAARPAEA
jgi:bifunctional enzyme CysN/CysC